MIAYLKSRIRVIAAFALFAAVFAVVFLLGGIPLGAVGYASAVCGAIALVFGIADYLKFRRKCAVLEKLKEEITVSCDNLPEPENVVEAGYSELIRLLFQSRTELEAGYESSFADMTDYYTMWAHQIKTPIAAMRLSLAEQDTPESRELSEELMRIEQYVEMVLCYVRLESSETDYVIRECSLDAVIRAALRKFSAQFIRKKLSLDYQPLDVTVLTDEKWLLFVISQVLSNSLKYTRSGGITITFENNILKLRDTGIGIAPEDLPRIFEKGYTGCNGRTDMKASGIGLYLCRRICRALGHTITALSDETGTVIEIGLERKAVDLRD
ncbi:MAG: sensor histidine kinase [Oscillospiraceae bacterium]|nr:sensor histidine kinase [Oscillospiraceae bacterium]